MDLKAELEELIRIISEKNTYAGNKIPNSVMRLFEIEIRENGGGVLVPFWIAVLQKGRGPRKTTKDYELYKIIFRWMESRNLFKSRTVKGKLSEAKSVTWYINKYGNKHFRSGVFVDIYQTARAEFIDKINAKYSTEISKITMEVI
jgi:hypothetical protein